MHATPGLAKVPPNVLRQILREETRDLHQRLDEHVGVIDSRACYDRYVKGTQAFRAALEPVLIAALADTGQPWSLPILLDALDRDLSDLGQTASPAPAPFDLHGISALAGALYVVEGSSLGARVIARQAKALGFDQTHGAGHLSLQTSQSGRWPAFLAWLESRPVNTPAAVIAARDTFSLAMRAHGMT